MDTLYTFWDSIAHYKNGSVHFWGLMNLSTEGLRQGMVSGFGSVEDSDCQGWGWYEPRCIGPGNYHMGVTVRFRYGWHCLRFPSMMCLSVRSGSVSPTSHLPHLPTSRLPARVGRWEVGAGGGRGGGRCGGRGGGRWG